MNLGQYIATIEANISNFERNLDKADSVYSSFAKKNIQAEKQRIEAIKNIVEQETGIRVNNAKEIQEVTKAYSASQISNIKKLANAYVVHNNKITKEEQARASAILRESQRIEKQKQKEANTLRVAEEKRARQAEQASARVQRALQKEAEKAEELRKRILQWSTLAITVPIVFGTKKAMQDFIAFQSELYNVKAVTGATSSEMKQMTETALEMSQVFSKTGTEIATAFLQLGQAGYEASEILTSAKDVMLLSAAGMKDIDFTAELVVTTLKAFNLEADQSGRIVDVFASSAAKSVSSLDKISASLKYTAGLWGSQNWEIENLVGILDVLFDTGVRGEKAGRLLASAINGLQKPTAGASRTIEKLLGSVDALNPAMNDVTAIVKKLADANAKTADIFQIFGKEGTDVMLRLIQNVEKIDGAIAEVTGQSGEAANQATIQMQSLGSQWDILKNKVTAFSKQVIGFMEPMFQSLVKGAGNFFDALNKMPDWLKTILTLGTTFALLGAPVAGLALKVKEFTAIMKIAGVTASATGLALKTAFPIMAAVGLAVGGIASAYAYSAKKHEEWVNSVNSGIEKFKEEGKTVEGMVKDIEKLYGTMEDTDKVTESLRELGQVFPELREYINKNAGDTAGAMAVMYEQLAKLNKERESLARAQADTATTTRDINIANETANLEKNQSILDKIISDIYKSENLTKDIITVMNNAFGDGTVKNIKDVSTYLGKISDEQMERLYTEIDKLNNIGDLKISMNVSQLRDAAIAIRTAKTELNELKARGQTPIAVAPVLADNYSLQEAIGEVVEKLKKQFGTFDIQITAGTAEAEAIIKSFGDIANSELLLIKEKYRKELMEVGAITPSGDWAEGFLKYMEEGAEKVALAFDGNLNDAMDKLLESSKSLLTGATVAGLDDAVKISEIQQSINANEVVLADLIKDKVKNAEQIKTLTDENNIYKEEELKLSKNVNTETRDALRILFGFLIESEKISGSGGTLNQQLDWWGQIKKQISDIKDLLKGTSELTSLTDIMNQLQTATGGEYDKVIALGKALTQAFTENPRLKWYAENFDIVNSVMDETIDKLKDLEIQQLKNAGIETSIPEYIRQLEEAGDKVDSLSQQMLALTIASEPMDISGVTETINAIKEEISKSGEVDFGSLLGEIEESQKRLQQQGKSTVQINEELVDLFGEQSVKLYNQTELAKALEQYYSDIKDKYGEGVIELISKKQLNDAIDAEEQMLVAIGKMGKAQYEANKAIRERQQLVANDASLKNMIEDIANGTAEIEEIIVVLESLNDTTFSDMIDSFNIATDSLTAVNNKIEELKRKILEAQNSGDIEVVVELEAELNLAEDTKVASMKKVTTYLNNTLSTVNDITASTLKLGEAIVDIKDGTGDALDNFTNISSSLSDVLNGFSAVTGGVTGVIAALLDFGALYANVMTMIEEAIYPTPDLSYMQEAFEEEIGNIKKIREIEQAVYSKYVSLGESIGSAIADGIKSGSAEVDIENIVKTQLYDLISQQILVSGGFNEKIAQAAKVVTTTVFKNADAIEALELQIVGFNKSLDDYGNSVDLLDAINSKKTLYRETDVSKMIEGWRAAFFKETEALKEGKNGLQKAGIDIARAFERVGKEIKWAADATKDAKANKDFNDQLDIQVAELQRKYEKAVDLEKKIKSAQDEIDRLTKEQGAGITTSELEINTDAINKMAEEYESIMKKIYEELDFQNAQVELEKNIRESLEGAFANAVLTGSYTDFKNAVYDMIVSNITQAIVSSGAVTKRLSSLVNSILDKATSTGETLTMDDASAILNEVQAVWQDATDENTGLGKLIMGLREGLSEFGAIEVDVNPGQVVTALPSEAMNKLDQAFQEVADRLSQAITESGLNSHIDLVNITTAYIERMTANSVVINNAVFDMSGDLVLNNISGATVGEFLENLIKEQVSASRP